MCALSSLIFYAGDIAHTVSTLLHTFKLLLELDVMAYTCGSSMQEVGAELEEGIMELE